MSANSSNTQTPMQLNQELDSAVQQLNQFMTENNLLDGAQNLLDIDLESNESIPGETKKTLSQIMNLLQNFRNSDESQSQLASSNS